MTTFRGLFDVLLNGPVTPSYGTGDILIGDYILNLV
jgi:hypothetical protein